RRQLASGDRSEYEPRRAPAPPGAVDGPGARGAAPGLSRSRLRTVRLGEQPAPVLWTLGAVHECGKLGRDPARPDHGPLRWYRDNARLNGRLYGFSSRGCLSLRALP